MRRMGEHLLPLADQSVAGSDSRTNGREWHTLLGGDFRDFRERRFQILANVIAQRFERRDVNHVDPLFEIAGPRLAHQMIEAEQKCGKCLTGTGGRGDQDIAARTDFWPTENLRFSGVGKTPGKPLSDEGIELYGRHGRKRVTTPFYEIYSP